jgi:hypothetical protein
VFAVDQWGTWLHVPHGSPWRAPDDAGLVVADRVVLMDPRHAWVPWWIEDPDERRLEIDVCLPPVSLGEDWSFVDLELCVRGDEFGFVGRAGDDDIRAAGDDGRISPEEAELALAAAHQLEVALQRGQEPFGAMGWSRLVQALRRAESPGPPPGVGPGAV